MQASSKQGVEPSADHYDTGRARGIAIVVSTEHVGICRDILFAAVPSNLRAHSVSAGLRDGDRRPVRKEEGSLLCTKFLIVFRPAAGVIQIKRVHLSEHGNKTGKVSQFSGQFLRDLRFFLVGQRVVRLLCGGVILLGFLQVRRIRLIIGVVVSLVVLGKIDRRLIVGDCVGIRERLDHVDDRLDRLRGLLLGLRVERAALLMYLALGGAAGAFPGA